MNSKQFTAGKVSVFEVFLVRIFVHLDLIRRDTEYCSTFSPNMRKYGPEALRIRTFYVVIGFYQPTVHEKSRSLDTLI